MDIITLTEYKTFKGISADTKNDAKISFLITSVSNLIETYIHADFTAQQSITETIQVDYTSNVIYLKHYPITFINSVVETNLQTTYDATVHVPLTGVIDYIPNIDDGSITRIVSNTGTFSRNGWPVSPGYVTVTYTTAPTYTSSSMPADLKMACIYLIDFYKDDEYRQSRSIQGTSLVNTMAQGTDFPKHIQVILDRYRYGERGFSRP
jgi:hypothetical protein